MKTLPAIIASYIDAYNRLNVADMLDCLSEDVTFRNQIGGKINVETTGKDQFAELAKTAVQAFETRNQTITNAITVAGTTLVEIDYTAVVALDLPNGWKAGEVLEFAGASAFQVKDGLIVSIIDQS